MIWINTFLYTALLSWGAAVFFYWRYQLNRLKMRQKLGMIQDKKERIKFSERFKKRIFSWSEKLIPLGLRFRLFTNPIKMERQIELAGHPGGLRLDSFYGFRFLCVFTGLLLGTLLVWSGFGNGVVLILFIMVGLIFPSLWLRAAARERQERLGLDLPDFMDAMSVSLQAGVPMDPAMKQIVSKMDGPLQEELVRFQQELDIGVPRDDAYVRLMNRNQSRELETLVNSLVQGSRLGVPISQTFQLLSTDMRETRIGMMKEKAAKAGPKVTLITSFLILPAVLLCIVGLLVLNFIYNPEGIGISWDALQ
ncbi:type II secretion system F family protein [Paenibacillus sp. WLX2291]|uniref:type II secretion system F family protein n=1 Tax=Paenibacillus sp. WLX2291 TaxID=3296934 RepID=UPI0039844B97